MLVLQSDEVMTKADVIVVAVGQDEEVVYSKSTSLQVIYLFVGSLTLCMHAYDKPI
jgi:hypothetical protein